MATYPIGAPIRRLTNERHLSRLERYALSLDWTWGVCERCDQAGPVVPRGEKRCPMCAGVRIPESKPTTRRAA